MPKHTLILAHGAGAPMNSDWMNIVTQYFEQYDVRVVRFNFPYMQMRMDTNTKRPPNTLPVLLDSYRDSISNTTGDIFIGGKSMGGRIATMVADEFPQVKGVIVFGYPFHPVGKPEKLRTAHLEKLSTPCLIVQGENDPFGKWDEWDGFNLAKQIHLHPIQYGNHDLKPLKKTGIDVQESLKNCVTVCLEFMNKIG